VNSRVLAPGQAVIGIDIGGTKIAAALIDHTEAVVDSRTVPTDNSTDTAILRQVEELALELLASPATTAQVIGIGLGVPGVVDSTSGIARYAANLPWRNTHMALHLQERFTLPVYLDNDANAGALGEKWFGKGREYANFVYLAIGTGIGSGIVVNGQLLTAAVLEGA
jgi:glucokinase